MIRVSGSGSGDCSNPQPARDEALNQLFDDGRLSAPRRAHHIDRANSILLQQIEICVGKPHLANQKLLVIGNIHYILPLMTHDKAACELLQTGNDQ